jgi:hypothetical protein
MSYVLGLVGAVLMTFSVPLGYWYLLSHYLEQRQRASKATDAIIAARLAMIRSRSSSSGGLRS